MSDEVNGFVLVRLFLVVWRVGEGERERESLCGYLSCLDIELQGPGK